MKRLLYIFLFFLLSPLSGGLQPEISSQDALEVLAHMTEAHSSQKTLTPPLLRRAFAEYLELLDNTKTYLLREEVTHWLAPTEEHLSTLLAQIEEGDFSPFIEIHDTFSRAIKRREDLELMIDEEELPAPVSYAEFAHLDWCDDLPTLKERLKVLRAVQLKAVSKLDFESQDKALLRIAKRRQTKEESAISDDMREKERLVLANVLKAFAASFDSHTAYFTPAEATQFMIQVQQRLFGIGAQLRDDLTGFRIVKIIEGGPATGSELKENDLVIAIDDEAVVGYDINDAVALIRGEEGTEVELTVLRDADKLSFPITRGEVVIQEARIESKIVPFGNGVVAVINLHGFYQDPLHSSSADLYDEIARIKREHKVKGVVLDLRTNSGGILPQAVAVTGLFITKGVVVSIKDNEGRVEHLRDIDGKMAYDGPLVILTSKATASASEIVAQTLQDYGRAIIVGDEHTFGKGTFQTFTLDSREKGRVNPKGEFKVTRGRYYTVSGKSPQLKGITPDIVVPGFLSKAEIGEQYTKYPLEYDEIDPNFQDDLSDIPPNQREHISWLYRFNLQQKLKIYTRFLPILQANSKARIEKNFLYQSLLNDLGGEEIAAEKMELYLKSDPQLQEGVNILKDLILLLN